MDYLSKKLGKIRTVIYRAFSRTKNTVKVTLRHFQVCWVSPWGGFSISWRWTWFGFWWCHSQEGFIRFFSFQIHYCCDVNRTVPSPSWFRFDFWNQTNLCLMFTSATCLCEFRLIISLFCLLNIERGKWWEFNEWEPCGWLGTSYASVALAFGKDGDVVLVHLKQLLGGNDRGRYFDVVLFQRSKWEMTAQYTLNYVHTK